MEHDSGQAGVFAHTGIEVTPEAIAFLRALPEASCWPDVAEAAVLGAGLEESIGMYSASPRLGSLLQEMARSLERLIAED